MTTVNGLQIEAGADLRGANLCGADLRGSRYDDATIWPVDLLTALGLLKMPAPETAAEKGGATETPA